LSKSGRQIGPLGYGDLPTSLLFIFPLYLAYEIGVMFSATSMNGVDFITRWVWLLLGQDRMRYLLVHAGLGVVFVVVLLYLRRKHSFSMRLWVPVILESLIYALTLGTVINLAMDKLLGFAVTDQLGSAIIISLGAGVHEELVFRLAILGGSVVILMRLGMRQWLAFLIMLFAQAVLFSAAHHVGPTGDAWALDVFTYRTLAGLAFGLIFYFRSLAHAVYAHAMYDVFVFILPKLMPQ
jgi:hypothetical protein